MQSLHHYMCFATPELTAPVLFPSFYPSLTLSSPWGQIGSLRLTHCWPSCGKTEKKIREGARWWRHQFFVLNLPLTMNTQSLSSSLSPQSLVAPNTEPSYLASSVNEPSGMGMGGDTNRDNVAYQAKPKQDRAHGRDEDGNTEKGPDLRDTMSESILSLFRFLSFSRTKKIHLVILTHTHIPPRA